MMLVCSVIMQLQAGRHLKVRDEQILDRCIPHQDLSSQLESDTGARERGRGGLLG